MFFTVLWKGLCQALGWFFGLFGYKRDGKFAKCVWGLFATSGAIILAIIAVVCLLFGCGKQEKKGGAENPFPVKYENEVFSVTMPKGWTYVDSLWCGLDKVSNEVDLYCPDGIVYLHCVKAFLPFKEGNIEAAKDMAKMGLYMRIMSGEDAELVDEEDSVEVDGCPASISYIVSRVDNDTIVQKQYVTFVEESNMMFYFNEIFDIHDSEQAQRIGDKIIANIRFKRVANPLDDNWELQHAIREGMNDGMVDEEYIQTADEVINESKD